MKARRVVTATAADGRSFVAADERLDPVTVTPLPGYSWHKLWGYDQPPGDPADATIHTGLSHFPPPGGIRFNLYTVPPSTTVRPPLTEAGRRELDEKLPGRGTHMESDQTGMHRTPSVDLIVVLSGQISLDLDGGVSVDLATGDTLVQNGTRHAWRNDSDQPCTCAIVLLGSSTD
jgi:quercetin dioxygenase-like cupin family protein